MDNIKIGDRVVDRTTGKHGVVDSFIRPLSFGYRVNLKARVKLDNGNIADVTPHNLTLEEKYEKPNYDPIGVNKLENPNDKAQTLTPAEPKKKKKAESTEAIIEAVTDENV